MISNLTMKEIIFGIIFGALFALAGLRLAEWLTESVSMAYCFGLMMNCIMQFAAYQYAKWDHNKKVDKFQKDLERTRSECEKLWDEERIYKD